jgi:hypothetical protein
VEAVVAGDVAATVAGVGVELHRLASSVDHFHTRHRRSYRLVVAAEAVVEKVAGVVGAVPPS